VRHRFGINKLLVEGAGLIKGWQGEETPLIEYNPRDLHIPGVIGGLSNVGAAAAVYFTGGLGGHSTTDGSGSEPMGAGWDTAQAYLLEQLPQLAHWLSHPALQQHAPAVAMAAGAALLYWAGTKGKSAARAAIGLGKLIYRPMHPTDVQGVEGIRTYRVEADDYSFRDMAESYERNFALAARAITELRNFFRYDVGELEEVRAHWKGIQKRRIRVIEMSAPSSSSEDNGERPTRWEIFITGLRRARDRFGARTR
jgi:hypothetical protein